MPVALNFRSPGAGQPPDRYPESYAGFARWTGRTPRIEIEVWADPGTPVCDADEPVRQVATALAREVPDAGNLTGFSRTTGRYRTMA